MTSSEGRSTIQGTRGGEKEKEGGGGPLLKDPGSRGEGTDPLLKNSRTIGKRGNQIAKKKK